MSSGNGVFINAMGYQLESQGYGNLQVQGKLHMGNSNKTGVDLSFTTSGGLLISPYTSTHSVVGPGYHRNITATSYTGTSDITAAAVLLAAA